MESELKFEYEYLPVFGVGGGGSAVTLQVTIIYPEGYPTSTSVHSIVYQKHGDKTTVLNGSWGRAAALRKIAQEQLPVADIILSGT